MKVAVFCGSRSGHEPLHTEKARELGEFFGRNGIDLVFGGGHVGLMGVIADAVMASGGRVYGVIPEHLVNRELAHPGLTELFVVNNMHERKAKMAELADAFVALPGGIGTLEEIFEVWTWAQLGFHKKPCAFYNVEGFYDSLLDMMKTMVSAGFVKQRYVDMIVVTQTPGELLEGFRTYTPPEEKWAVTRPSETNP